MRAALLMIAALILVSCSRGDAMKVPEPNVAEAITVTSPAFGEGEPIPREYTCRGTGGPPELIWHGVPDGAVSLALVVSDPDVPRGTFIHWVVYDLPPSTGRLAYTRLPAGAQQAVNSGGKKGWYPPCPPSGTHHYLFTVYALSGSLSGTSADILNDIGHLTVARGTLTGLVSAG